ncbi:MAG: N-carbamoylsarcosine amidase [Alphaproteobacteria bacterium MarineAlpha2_Bin1]|nr:MAG: N-carbamoylsarcosine amidase [Alphaproteobacteria bacterium MarineAlpha2_Bin1]
MALDNKVRDALDTIFASDSELYADRGWNTRNGFGKNPVLLNIDLANAWTRPGYKFSCNDMDELIIPGVQSLLKACRSKKIPIIYTTTGFCSAFDMGAFPVKAPSWNDLILGTPACEIDERVAPISGTDTLIVKKRPSAFAGTHLGGILRAAKIDTLICTGVTLAGCVRHTVEDALGEGFRTVVVRECVGDRAPAAVEWNLFDIDMKYADVEPLSKVLDYIEKFEPSSSSIT